MRLHKSLQPTSQKPIHAKHGWLSDPRVERLRRERGNVIWLDQMLPKREVIQLLSHATVFACPSIYEPLGIVNLEAMACEVPVVASRCGEAPNVVGEAGLLFAPDDVDGLAQQLRWLMDNPDLRRQLAAQGRRRAAAHFTMQRVAEDTAVVYRALQRND